MTKNRIFVLFCWLLLAAACQTGRSPDEALNLPGLNEPVEIIRDRWGISHIYASNQHDLFFAQGFSAARDRLFQLELWRRQATGTLSEAFGSRFIEQDTGARLLRLRADMQEEMRHYHPDGEEIIRAFAAGVNAYVDLANQDPDSLPLEFRLLGLKPGHWTPEVVVSRHNGLFRNVRDELSFARLTGLVGEAKLKEALDLSPGDPSLALEEGIEVSASADEILKLYRASRSRPSFLPEDIVDPASRAPQPSGARNRFAPADRPQIPDHADAGSNNWVLSAQRSTSGHPFMANDPHRSLQVPSLRYFVHLVAPGWDVIGGGEPALPGVSIGHNQHGAWGLTIFSVDQEDLYVYRTNPDNPLEYRYQEGWETMEAVEETIPVRGEEPRTVLLKYTRHGPVLYQDAANHTAYVLRAAWLEVGAAPYLASLRFGQASNWEEFQQACKYFLTPSENMVFAGRDGDIGWQATGITPIRPNWNGLLPVPGDGRFEWQGYLPPLDLPAAFNPPNGFLATANHNNLPQGYPHTIGFRWAEPYRFQRLQEALSEGQKLGLEEMKALQQDESSIPAAILVSLLKDLDSEAPEVRQALEMLREWDFVLKADSAAAALYQMWERRLEENAWRLAVGEELADSMSRRPFTRVVSWLSRPDERFGAEDPQAGRNALLLQSLQEAVLELQKRFGVDSSLWRYGDDRFHHVLIRHPMSRAVNSELRARLDAGPLPRGGNRYTVNMTTGNDNQRSGASFRLIADLSDWDLSLATNTPGQSGDPESPHYRDLFRMWAEGEYFPLLYSRQRVMEEAALVVTLQPK